VDGELYGLRDVVVTRSVRPDCVSADPCLRSPCVDDAQCVSDGLDGFRCVCAHSDCYRPVPLTTPPQLPLEQQVEVPLTLRQHFYLRFPKIKKNV